MSADGSLHTSAHTPMCPRCGLARDIYKFCNGCGYDFSLSAAANGVYDDPGFAREVRPPAGGDYVDPLDVLIPPRMIEDPVDTDDTDLTAQVPAETTWAAEPSPVAEAGAESDPPADSPADSPPDAEPDPEPARSPRHRLDGSGPDVPRDGGSLSGRRRSAGAHVRRNKDDDRKRLDRVPAIRGNAEATPVHDSTKKWVNAQTPKSSESQPDDSSGPVGGSSAPLLLGLVAAAVIALLLIGAALVSIITPADEDPSPVSATPTPTPEREQPDDEQRCWHGTKTESVADCPAPWGTKGLAWVFPSFDGDGCARRGGSDRRPTWVCETTVPDGVASVGRVQIRYSGHDRVSRGIAAYDASYRGDDRSRVFSERDDVERIVWRSSRADNNGIWRMSSLYMDQPWSVTVRGRSATAVEYAFEKMVEFREPRRLRG
ncbi:MAG: hypothetical protein ACRCYQ_12790 [Nocardioides sp.]